MPVSDKEKIMQKPRAARTSEAAPLIGGSYKVTYFRNSAGACEKSAATEEIVHFYDMHGSLVHCEYHKLASKGA